ncbi:hypothetical protein Y032_0047g1483 [Ancylostoma ceylanicum]|uniref:Uncharacterized protein n=1 Tax=Ancylostoma ceylanicum TaxID=53326 RepID=A0A016UBX9_9BILA|nr:hypothetical protein Y032_0047g1483 [Ancylostoma ceylanicum]
MGTISFCRRGGARKGKKDTDEGWRWRAEPAPRRADNATQRVHFCGNGAPAPKSGEMPGDGSNGAIRVRLRPKVGEWLETGPTGVIRVRRRPKAGKCLGTGPTA